MKLKQIKVLQLFIEKSMKNYQNPHKRNRKYGIFSATEPELYLIKRENT